MTVSVLAASSALAVVLVVALVREVRLRRALQMLLRRLIEHWRMHGKTTQTKHQAGYGVDCNAGHDAGYDADDSADYGADYRADHNLGRGAGHHAGRAADHRGRRL